eukprot:4747998-Prymnesium_polylepis.1
MCAHSVHKPTLIVNERCACVHSVHTTCTDEGMDAVRVQRAFERVQRPLCGVDAVRVQRPHSDETE